MPRKTRQLYPDSTQTKQATLWVVRMVNLLAREISLDDLAQWVQGLGLFNAEFPTNHGT